MKYILILCLLAPFAGRAQSGPQLSFETFAGAGFGGMLARNVPGRALSYRDVAGRLGFGLTASLSDRISVRASWQMTEYVESFPLGFTPDKIGEEGQTLTLDDLVYLDNLGEPRVSNRQLFVQYSLDARYYIFSYTRLRPYFEGGLGAAAYKGTFVGGEFGNWSLRDNQSYRSFSLVTRAGGGLDYRVIDQISVFVTGAGSFHATSLLGNDRGKLNPWKIDGEIGARFSIF